MSLCQCGCGQLAPIAPRTLKRYRLGEPQRFIQNHHRRARTSTYYKQVGRNGLLHRIRAERALGKPLPIGAVVHHADGSRDDDAPLVICPDNAYHRALHARMRVAAAGGNPWTEQICSRCRRVMSFASFGKSASKPTGYWQYCRGCDKERKQQQMQEQAQAAAVQQGPTNG